ncbi:MAG TPA: STAS domain-containing protein [Caulobacterales bacterium]|nr:STAS domain-containing protein [Caulobacterales bacterium]
MSANAILCLPAMLDLNAAPRLKSEFRSYEGAPLDIDAGKVERVGGLCLQVLIAAGAAWRRAGLALRVLNASPAFVEDVRIMGAAALLPQSEGDAAC